MKRDPRQDRVSQGGEGVPRRIPHQPEAPPAEADDLRVLQLLRLYPEYDAPRWVQSMVGWRRKAAEYKSERDEALRRAERLEKVLIVIAETELADQRPQTFDEKAAYVMRTRAQAALSRVPRAGEEERGPAGLSAAE